MFAAILLYSISLTCAKNAYSLLPESLKGLTGTWYGALSIGDTGHCSYNIAAVIDLSPDGKTYILRKWQAEYSLCTGQRPDANINVSNREMRIVTKSLKVSESRKKMITGLEFATYKHAKSDNRVVFLQRVGKNKLVGNGWFKDRNRLYYIHLSRK